MAMQTGVADCSDSAIGRICSRACHTFAPCALVGLVSYVRKHMLLGQVIYLFLALAVKPFQILYEHKAR
jgi:hypothetical protein